PSTCSLLIGSRHDDTAPPTETVTMRTSRVRPRRLAIRRVVARLLTASRRLRQPFSRKIQGQTQDNPIVLRLEPCAAGARAVGCVCRTPHAAASPARFAS